MRKLLICLILIFVSCGLLQAEIGETVSSFKTPANHPTGLTFDGKYLWNADIKTDSLYKIDPSKGNVVSTYPSPGYKIADICFDGKYLWCLDLEENLIFQFDPENNIILRTLYAPTENAKAMTYDGEYLWLSDTRADEIMQISTEDGTTIKSFQAPEASAEGLTFDGTYLWASDRYRDKIFLIEPENGWVIFSFDSPGKYPRGLAFDGKNLWNCDYQSDSIYSLKVKDKANFSRWDEKHQVLEYINQVRNYGPGELLDLELYMAVPHSRDNQDIIGDIIYDPAPTQIKTDKWGQQVAVWHYDQVPSGEIREVSRTTECKLYSIRYCIYPEDVGSLEDIPEDIREKFLVDDSKYSINDPFILKAVNQAVGTETNLYWKVRKIYHYIIENMYYELAGGWNIAPTVLKRGSGSCSEYSFVFISMCRSAGIPVRYVGSVAVRGDDASTDEVFHRWCEVYFPNVGWFPIDPSGGDDRTPGGESGAFGSLSNRFLITTEGGGGSEYLEWGYNSNALWKCRGKCKVYEEHFGEWSPFIVQNQK